MANNSVIAMHVMIYAGPKDSANAESADNGDDDGVSQCCESWRRPSLCNYEDDDHDYDADADNDSSPYDRTNARDMTHCKQPS